MKPSFLAAYPKLTEWQKGRQQLGYAGWVLDSGAFSAWTTGLEISLQDYIDCCKRELDEERSPEQIFALDVVGDWKAGLANTEEMWRQGVEATPCYHMGEPWSVLAGLAKDYPRIAIGGVGKSLGAVKMKFSEQCFARVWPKVIHGFALCNKRWVEALPFASVDSASWFLQPIRYGLHKALASTGREISVPHGSLATLRCEVEFYLQLQESVRFRWRKQMEAIGAAGPTLYLGYPGPKVRTGFEI